MKELIKSVVLGARGYRCMRQWDIRQMAYVGAVPMTDSSFSDPLPFDYTWTVDQSQSPVGLCEYELPAM